MPDAPARNAALGPLVAAVSLLTRVPVGRWACGPADVARGAPLFPLVGAGLGAAVGATAWALALAVPALVAGAAAVGVELALTGAVHADGLADSADGLAGRDRRRALVAMRDHSVGAYGSSALTLSLVAKVAAIAALAETGAVLAVVAALAVSRAAPLPLAVALPYADGGGGTGRVLTDRLGVRSAVAGVVLAAAVATAATGAVAIWSLAGLAAAVGVVGALARSRLGGVTGDVMGAAVELTAVLALASAAGALA